VCKSVIALYLNVIKKEFVTKVLINPIIRTRTRHFRREYHPIRDNTLTFSMKVNMPITFRNVRVKTN
jgi:hypothetical protein